jgi:Ca2+-binding RTX toxin-like protein
VIVGGTDGGLSMFELLPGGTFFHHMNAVQSLEWNIGTITGITTHLTGSEVKVFVASAGDGGLAELSLSLEDLGTRWTGTSGADQYTGTAGHDMILGGSGNDRLSGGAGNDVIHAGRGEDRLAGGSGADTFVFVADGTADRIDDFEVGVDKIDLTGWGMLYHISDLQIRGRGDGATIRFEGEEIRLVNADGTRIEAADLDQDDFIF